MRKVIFILLALIFLTSLIVSNNKDWMIAISDYRFSMEWLAPDKFKHGDLYGFCFISKFKEPTKEAPLKMYDNIQSNTNLYIMHDSYLQKPLNKNNFKQINTLKKVDYRGNPTTITLNPFQSNILIIETAERYARWRFQNPDYFINQLKVQNESLPNLSVVATQEGAAPSDTNMAWKIFVSKAFNPNINSNLEFNLFDYSFFSGIRGIKTSINLKLFGKLNEGIAVSTDRHYLFLKETIDTLTNTGIYNQLSVEEIDNIVMSMDVIRKHFISKGFREVYFAIIPNTVTIVDSSYMKNTHYNGFMYKMRYKMKVNGIPYIDVYSKYLQNKEIAYKHGDSHWSSAGKQLWIEEVNEKMSENLRK